MFAKRQIKPYAITVKQVLFIGLAGIGILVAGFYCGYIFIQDPSRTILLLFASLFLFVVGLFVLSIAEKKAAKLHNTPPEFATKEPDTGESAESVLERNNRMVSEWNATSEKRDKLKMMKYAAEANAKEKKY